MDPRLPAELKRHLDELDLVRIMYRAASLLTDLQDPEAGYVAQRLVQQAEEETRRQMGVS